MATGDLKKTRAYQEAEQARHEKFQAKILSMAVPDFLNRGMTIEEIADICELPSGTIQASVPQPE